MSETGSISDAEIENDLELILDGDQAIDNDQIEEVVADTNENEENVNETKTVKPKRVVRNPQPKLNEQTLKGPRGLTALESYFERVKFKGRGHEEEDLNVLMKTYEYWCHRLFPKFPFDSCIARLEKLGTKKSTKTQIKKIRMGLNFDEAEHVRLSDEEVNETSGFVDTYSDQFDLLTSATEQPEPTITEEQLERIRQNMERAKQLREEKLRKTQSLQNNTQNESTNQMDTENVENSQFVNSTLESDLASSCHTDQINASIQPDHANSPNNDSQSQNINEIECVEMEVENFENNKPENEDNIDNILNFINEGDTSGNNQEV